MLREMYRPGPGMLAQHVTSKNSDAVPLECQSKILARGGARVAPSTLDDWYARAADLVEPLWRALRDDALQRYLISLGRRMLVSFHGGTNERPAYHVVAGRMTRQAD